MEGIKKSKAYIFLNFSKIYHLGVAGVDEYLGYRKHIALECAFSEWMKYSL